MVLIFDETGFCNTECGCVAIYAILKLQDEVSGDVQIDKPLLYSYKHFRRKCSFNSCLSFYTLSPQPVPFFSFPHMPPRG